MFRDHRAQNVNSARWLETLEIPFIIATAMDGWFRSLEEAAHGLLETLGWASYRVIDPFAAFAPAGFRTSARAPRGCAGFLTRENGQLVVRVDRRGHPHAQNARARHEWGHIVALQAGLEVHREDREHAADYLGDAFSIPRGPLLQRLREEPTLGGVLHAYADVAPLDMLRRIAVLTGSALMFHTARNQLSIVANDNAWPLDAEMKAHALVQTVRITGHAAAHPDGMQALPIVQHDRHGIAVLAPLRDAG